MAGAQGGAGAPRGERRHHLAPAAAPCGLVINYTITDRDGDTSSSDADGDQLQGFCSEPRVGDQPGGWTRTVCDCGR